MELRNKVRELREQGMSPKEIARALGVPPSKVAPLVRAIAAEAEAAAPEVVGAWVNTGWSVGLTTRGWTDEAPVEGGSSGMVSVLVAKSHGWDKLEVCGYLVDVYCLGVKHTIGPDIMSEVELRRFREFFFSDYAGRQEAPFALARELVLGSVEYARGLGFEPGDDFAPLAAFLGERAAADAGSIEFGRDGRPFYVAGPGEDPRKVLRQLEKTGDDFGYYIVPENAE
ncbi:helix-turn-helix domain-containing protein [Nonomuraea africana]|uniref:Helix-turn-helix domain-containing protein n=1 Tax=Nonomuraea africana TaxID=46171 RepID=A0ABR9KVP1_9ACTN|nr:helix-turn-helix domain-containing protein [Nonomuraea africana]MBE1566101.1 hypothetical protein [Nonomuraea africana]